MQMPRDDFARTLVNQGYAKVALVENSGEFAVRGSLIDCYPCGSDNPIRIEFYDETIESIREFHSTTQRTIGTMEKAIIWPNRHISSNCASTGILPLLEQAELPWQLIVDEPAELTEQISADKRDAYTSFLSRNTRFFISAFQERTSWMTVSNAAEFSCSPIEFYSGNINLFTRDLLAWITKGYNIHLITPTETEATRFQKILAERGIAFHIASPANNFRDYPAHSINVGELKRGFMCTETHEVFVSDADIFRRFRTRPRKFSRFEQKIHNWGELQEGDYVVHLDYGIGRFKELVSLKVSGQFNDYFQVDYKGTDRLYVPLNQMDRLHKYVGSSDNPPAIHGLEGAHWGLTKKRVHKATQELAQSVMRLYAIRRVHQGSSFSADTPWQWELEASFPYEETPDQLAAIEQVKKDMESPEIMDHLVCGDSGYGKTEIAIRSSFKAVMDGKQVVVIVPTTILADQHCNTFRQRMTSFPIHIEMLSRFQAPRQRKLVMQGLAEGTVDIVIGTHRLLQKDVRFKDLGLLVIDEEHKFGVEQKKRLKELHNMVDVLSLSATPIPRSLQMALSGLHSLSTIGSPPVQRQNVVTHVTAYSENIVREAITNEIGRKGQVFYLHNRITSIGGVAHKLQQLFPHLRISVAHGQMQSLALEQTIEEFVTGKSDILLCTSIIESGIDMPNVNTIIVENAGQFGLADLYQLRGRVGRGYEKGHAYLLFSNASPMKEEVKRRLEVIRKFTGPGAGLKIAMEDLHLRGAGNLLGREQHGHISSVGFTLYAQLLADEVKKLKKEKLPPRHPFHVNLGIEARIPSSYVAPKHLRTQLYRRIGDIRDGKAIAAFAGELQDRFGPLPHVTRHLIQLLEIKLIANTLGLVSITRTTNGLIHLKFSSSKELSNETRVHLREALGDVLNVYEEDKTTLTSRGTPPVGDEELLAWVRELLQKTQDVLTLTLDPRKTPGGNS